MKIDIEFNSGAQLPMDAIPELARLAEAHGFDCAWGGEAVMQRATARVMLRDLATGSEKRVEIPRESELPEEL